MATSPRGLQESNGRAVISALKTLQDKIRAMERQKLSETPRSVEQGTNTPREMVRKVAKEWGFHHFFDFSRKTSSKP